MLKDYYILKVVDSNLIADLDYREHINFLDEYLAGAENYIFDYTGDSDKRQIQINTKHGTEYIQYVSARLLTMDMINNADEIDHQGEISKRVLKMIYEEYNNEQEVF